MSQLEGLLRMLHDPLVLQRIVRDDSPGRIGVEHLRHEVLGRGRDVELRREQFGGTRMGAALG